MHSNRGVMKLSIVGPELHDVGVIKSSSKDSKSAVVGTSTAGKVVRLPGSDSVDVEFQVL